MSWTKVTVDRNNYRFPNRCPECLKYGPQGVLTIASDTYKVTGYYVVAMKYQQLRVRIPFSTECAAKRKRNERYGSGLSIAAIVVAVAIAFWLDLGHWQTFGLAVLLGAPAIWLMYYHGWQVRVRGYSDETLTFSFKHPEYAQEFIKLNGGRVG